MIVHVYTEPGMASVNSYIVEGAAGVVVIDAQRSLSSARQLLGVIQQTQKPVEAIFLTHPHPDHFGGLPILASAYPQVPVYALAQTRGSIASGANGYIEMSTQALGEDFDADIPLPARIVQDGEELTLAGIRFQMEDAGIGEADCMLMLYAPDDDTLFCADVIQHDMTAFLLEGHLREWIAQVNRIAAKYAGVQKAYPGHGVGGAMADLCAYQLAYLQTFQQLLAAHKDTDGKMSSEDKAQVVQAMEQTYPGFLPVAMIPNLLEMDVDALAAGTADNKEQAQG